MTGDSGPIGPRTCEQQAGNGLSENSIEGNNLKGIANFIWGIADDVLRSSIDGARRELAG
jgi:hypothetical protein